MNPSIVPAKKTAEVGSDAETLGRRASGVVHDLNNLLTIITGHADLLLNDSTLVRRQRDSIVEISQAAERAGVAARQLLALCRNPNRAAEADESTHRT